MVGAAIGCLGLSVLTACGTQSSGLSGPTAEQDTGMSRYVQTWSKDYDNTSCAEWVTRMTDQQRWTAALEMLKKARNGDNAFAPMPADARVDGFKTAVGASCAATGADTIAQAGAKVYLSGKRAYHP
jgi:hypothetical protein